MEKCIIAAVADNWAIGRDNALLWHISEDMKYFRKVTSGSPVIMGRRTYESIGRPLPGRRNIVVSRTPGEAEGVETASSLDGAFALAAGPSGGDALQGGPERCFVLGGGEIYRLAMPETDRLYITHVHCTIEDADTFFPEISPEKWKEESRSPLGHDPVSGLGFEFVTYIRRT